jgi:hypothetical protein
VPIDRLHLHRTELELRDLPVRLRSPRRHAAVSVLEDPADDEDEGVRGVRKLVGAGVLRQNEEGPTVLGLEAC